MEAFAWELCGLDEGIVCVNHFVCLLSKGCLILVLGPWEKLSLWPSLCAVVPAEEELWEAAEEKNKKQRRS